MSYALMYPRGLPHLKQRLITRDLNLGFLFAFAIIDFFAIYFLYSANLRIGEQEPSLLIYIRHLD